MHPMDKKRADSSEPSDDPRAESEPPDGPRKMRISRPIPAASRLEPTDEELLRLLEGTLSEDLRRALEVQLHECPYSADRIAIMRAALEQAGVEIPEPLRPDKN